MSLYCASDDPGDYEWWWEWDKDEPKPLATKRSRKCCSCGCRIKPGEPAVKIVRRRNPRNDIEIRIYGDEAVYRANWYFCEECNDLALSLDELGFCFELGRQSLKQQLAEYREEEARHVRR